MKYKVDLTDYDVLFERWEIKDGKRELVSGVEPLKVKDEMFTILRVPGVYKDGVETCDGVDLANRIKSAEDSIVVETKELDLIKRVFNKLIAQEHKPLQGQMAMGGDRYIELITRIFKAEEVSD